MEAEIDEVTIRPLELRPAFFQPLLDEMERLAPKHEEPEDLDPYVPEQAERPPFRARMPRIDEFPVPAQNQMRAREVEVSDENVEKRQMTLLEKLASSFSRKVPAAPPIWLRRRRFAASRWLKPRFAVRRAGACSTRAAVRPGLRKARMISKSRPSSAVRRKPRKSNAELGRPGQNRRLFRRTTGTRRLWIQGLEGVRPDP